MYEDDPRVLAALVSGQMSGCREPPFGLLEVPTYVPVERAFWYLRPNKEHRLIRGYFTGLQVFKEENWVLFRGKRVWMSITPMERESLALGVREAYGTVVVMGLGMGMVVYNLLKKEEVRRVIVVERDTDIIRMFSRYSADWKIDRSKLEIVEGDARTWKPQPDEHVDCLLIDIWPSVGDSKLLSDTTTIQRRVRADHVHSWGQELELITWCAEHGLPQPMKDEYQLQWQEDTGIPWMGCDIPGYGELCVHAALTMIADSAERKHLRS